MTDNQGDEHPKVQTGTVSQAGQPQAQPAEPDRRKDRATDVDPSVVVRRVLGYPQSADGQRAGDHGQEHHKGSPPGPVIEDRAGDRGRDAAGDSRGGGPDTDRTGFLVGGKALPEQGKAVGQDQGSAQALQEPADDERGETRRETNRGRAQAIESDPREEDPLLSEPVTQSAGDQG